MNEPDPMLSPDDGERARYQESVMDTMRCTIEEDRAARRSGATREEPPATLIGATGMPGGLNEAIR